MKIISEERMVLTPDMMANRTFREPQRTPRSRGVHISAVNKALGIAAGKLTSEDDPDFPFEKFSDTHYPLLPAIGVAWEEFRASIYGPDLLIYPPAELERDGIYGSPDGFLMGRYAWWECKYSTKKIQSISALWMYLKQGLCYCAMSTGVMGQMITIVQYDICFGLGDYTRPYKPIGQVSTVEFSQHECESWWAVVKQAAKDVKPE